MSISGFLLMVLQFVMCYTYNVITALVLSTQHVHFKLLLLDSYSTNKCYLKPLGSDARLYVMNCRVLTVDTKLSVLTAT